MRRLLISLPMLFSLIGAAFAQGSVSPGGGSVSQPSFSGPISPSSISGWTPTFGLRQDANGTASGGSGYATSDVLTLLGGICTIQPTVVLWSSGAAPTFTVVNPGVCTIIPSDPVASTGGSGSNATFTLSGKWGPLAADVPIQSQAQQPFNGSTFTTQDVGVFYPSSLSRGTLNFANRGPICFGPIGACGGNANNFNGMGGGTGITGYEITAMGAGAAAELTSGFQDSFFGHNAGGQETTGSFISGFGSDACKYEIGGANVDCLGAGAGKFLISPAQVTAVGTGAAAGEQFSATVSAAVNSGGACLITVSSTAGMLTGDTAVVTGVQGATGCNGTFANVTVSGSTILLTGSTFGGSYTTGGSVLDFGSVGMQNVVAVGYQALGGTALRSNGTRYITAIGGQAAFSLTTGGLDTCTGWNACPNVTSSGWVTADGAFAGKNLSTGSSGVFVGFNAGVPPSQSGANDVVAIGGNGGGGNGATCSGASVCIGSKTGSTQNITGGFNILLGYNLGNTNCGSGSNVIEIFTNSGDCSASNASNEIQIGTGASAMIQMTSTGTPTSATTTLHGSTFKIPDISNSTTAQTGTMCWASGGITYDNTNTCLVSSARFKEGIAPLRNALNEVMKINPARFSYKGQDDEQIGLIAENVAKVDPRLVVNDDQGQPLKVRYINTVALLVGAIHDQQKEIEMLKKMAKYRPFSIPRKAHERKNHTDHSR